MATPPDPRPPPEEGWLLRWFHAIKELSLTNVLVIIILVIALVPAYALWRLLNDASMLGKFLSYYEEIASDKSPCTIRIASLRGSGEQYSISTGFAYEGSDRWTIAVLLDHKPDDTQLQTYCETLNLIVDYMRRPDAPSPMFPNSEDPLIWRYPPEPKS